VRRVPSLLVSCLLLGATTAPAQSNAPATNTAPADSAAPLALASLPDENGLAALLWERSPEFALSRARLVASQAELVRARQLPNPTLDIAANTLPVGPTNPPGLNRLTQVPNVGAGLSSLIELGKRGPRSASAQAALASTALDVQSDLRTRTYDVLERAAEVATAEVRLAELERLAEDAARLTELQRVRAQRGDTAGLDVDRATLEETQLQGQLAEERAQLAEALLQCSQTVGLSCAPFGSREAASQFLSERLARPLPASEVQRRPDLLSLEAQRRSAQSSLTLARRRWIPDPTVRAGYLRDQFLISGNQRDSVGLSLSIPLPVFDHGQADALAASAQASASERARAQLTTQAERDAQTLTTQRDALAARRERVRNQTLPLAASLVKRLEATVKAGGASLQDLLIARRTYGQLLLDAADIDLAAFRVSVDLDRVRSAGPQAPAELGARF
jgi:outer membrane protein, heavy metal efflux system